MAEDRDDISFGISMDASKAEASIKSFNATLGDLSKMADVSVKDSLSSLDSKLGGVGNSFSKQQARIKAVADEFDRLSKSGSEATSQLITLSKSIIVPKIVLPNFSQVLKANFGDSVSIAKDAARDIQSAFDRIRVPRPTVEDIRGSFVGSRAASIAGLGDIQRKLSASLASSQFSSVALAEKKAVESAKSSGKSFESLEQYKARTGVQLPNYVKLSTPEVIPPQEPKMVRFQTMPDFSGSKVSGPRNSGLVSAGSIAGSGVFGNWLSFKDTETIKRLRSAREEEFALDPALYSNQGKSNRKGGYLDYSWVGAFGKKPLGYQGTSGMLPEEMRQGVLAPSLSNKEFTKLVSEKFSKEEASKYSEQLKLLQKTSLTDKFRSAAVPMRERQTAFLRTGSALTPYEDIAIQKALEKERKAEQDRQAKEAREAEKKKLQQQKAAAKAAKEREYKWTGDWTTVPAGFSPVGVMTEAQMKKVPLRKAMSNEAFAARMETRFGEGEGQRYLAQLERIKKGTVWERTQAGRIPMRERQAAYIRTGSAITPTEEALADSRDRKEEERAKRQQERDLRAQERQRRAEERAASRGGAFTVAQKVVSELTSDTKSVISFFGGVFDTIGSLASKTSGIISTAFKTAFIGLTAAGAAAVAGLTASFLGVKKLVDVTVSGANRGKELAVKSQQTGAGVGDIIKMERAFSAANVDPSYVTNILAWMARSKYKTAQYQALPESKQEKSGASKGVMHAPTFFNKLGLKASEMKTKSEMEAFIQLGSAIAAIKSPTDRATAAMSIFHMNGERLLALFSNPRAMDLLREKLTGTAKILEQQSFKLRAAYERYEMIRPPTMKEGMQQVGVGIASEVSGVFLKMSEGLGRIDVSSIGVSIGYQIGLALEAFRSGKAAQYLKDSFLLFKTYVSDQLASLFEGTFFSPDTTDFYNNLLSIASEFGVSLMSFADSLSEKILGMSLTPILSELASAAVTVGSVMVSVGSMIISATARVAQWVEMVANLVKGFNIEKAIEGVETGGAIGAGAGGLAGAAKGALSGAAIGSVIPVIGTGAGALIGAGIGGTIGVLGGGAVGAASGFLYGGLKNSSGVGAPTTITDSNISGVDSAMSKLRDVFNRFSESAKKSIDVIEGRVSEEKNKPEATPEDLMAAQLRQQRLAIDKAKADLDAYKSTLPDPMAQQAKLLDKKTAPRWAGIVASSMQEIGGGGGVYVPTGGEKLETAAQTTANNTAKIAQYQQELLQKLGVYDQGPTITGLTLGQANADPETQQALMDLVNKPLSGSATPGAKFQEPTQEVQSMLDEIERNSQLKNNPQIKRTVALARASRQEAKSGVYSEPTIQYSAETTPNLRYSNSKAVGSVVGTASIGATKYESNAGSTPNMNEGNQQQLNVLGSINSNLEKILNVLSRPQQSGQPVIKVGL